MICETECGYSDIFKKYGRAILPIENFEGLVFAELRRQRHNFALQRIDLLPHHLQLLLMTSFPCEESSQVIPSTVEVARLSQHRDPVENGLWIHRRRELDDTRLRILAKNIAVRTLIETAVPDEID